MFRFARLHTLSQWTLLLVITLFLLTSCATSERSSYNNPRQQTYVQPQALMLAPVAAGAALGNPGSQYALTRTAVQGAGTSFTQWLMELLGVTTRKPDPNRPR